MEHVIGFAFIAGIIVGIIQDGWPGRGCSRFSMRRARAAGPALAKHARVGHPRLSTPQ